jgi:hypothetical protein
MKSVTVFWAWHHLEEEGNNFLKTYVLLLFFGTMVTQEGDKRTAMLLHTKINHVSWPILWMFDVNYFINTVTICLNILDIKTENVSINLL